MSVPSDCSFARNVCTCTCKLKDSTTKIKGNTYFTYSNYKSINSIGYCGFEVFGYAS